MTTMTSSLVTTITDTDFNREVIASNRLVLVDFWADWCGPCHAIAPILEDIAAEYSEQLKVGKLNVDDNQQIPSQFGVRAIPTLLLFKDGELKETIVGVQPKSKLVDIIKAYL